MAAGDEAASSRLGGGAVGSTRAAAGSTGGVAGSTSGVAGSSRSEAGSHTGARADSAVISPSQTDTEMMSDSAATHAFVSDLDMAFSYWLPGFQSGRKA
jgi:hypothetical protein